MDIKAKCNVSEYWIVEMEIFPGQERRRYIIEIYSILSDNLGFLMPGYEQVFWQSQIEYFKPIKKIELYAT